MFGDFSVYEEIAEALLSDFTLEELLELNNLTELEVLSILVEGGHVGQPERYFERGQGESED